MTSYREPPRLRRLKNELPPELVVALADAPEEDATPAELAGLALRLRGALSQPVGDAAPVRRLPRNVAVRGPLSAIALTFSLGAAAGVLASAGVYFAFLGGSAEPSRSAVALSSAAPQVHLHAAPPVSSATPLPEPAEAALPPPRPLREPARPPTQNVEPEAAEASSPPDAGSRDELDLLARAQGALGSNPGLALALTREHEKQFVQGALSQEREVVAIDALLRLGRRTEATSRSVRFHQQFPTSVHGRRVDVLLGNASAASADHN